jgi:hypothetical protein
MSKDLASLDVIGTPSAELEFDDQISVLDDLSLSLIGGGEATVAL